MHKWTGEVCRWTKYAAGEDAGLGAWTIGHAGSRGFARVHARTFPSVYFWSHAHAHAHAYAHTRARARARTRTYTHTRARTRAREHARKRARAHTRARAHAHAHTRIVRYDILFLGIHIVKIISRQLLTII